MTTPVGTPVRAPVGTPVTTDPRIRRDEASLERIEPARPWIVIVWNDPINLMSYVTYVFRKLFGYSEARAHELMMQVHAVGRAVVAEGTRERCEYDVSRLHAHGLWASMQEA
jgi:ATP-dependent Clp protease adaptor protein ClpS